MKMNFNKFLFSIFVFLLLISFVNAEFFNEQGDFLVSIDKLKKETFNDDISAQYTITVKNNLNTRQRFDLISDKQTGWDLQVSSNSFSLGPGEEIELVLKYEANSNFNYGTNVISPDTIIIAQKDNYIGSSSFPISLKGDSQEVKLNLQLEIKKREKANEVFFAEFSTRSVSPEIPISFAVRGENLEGENTVKIVLDFAGQNYEYVEIFSQVNNYHIYERKVISTISPGTYDAEVLIRLEKQDSDVVWEWRAVKQIDVIEYIKVDERISEKRSLFVDKNRIDIMNLGNTDQVYQKKIESSFLKNFLLSSNVEYEIYGNDIFFSEDLNKGEFKTIEFNYNYLPVYLIVIVLIILISYIYIRKSSNPIEIETSLYEVKRVQHEGVKSLKVKIGFENIKEIEIDNLALIFRMPKYLNIKDNSFLLTPPNQVLKGKEQYKLIWEFKRFEKDETRVIGFTLVNARGILGDIKIPDIEIEVKAKGKVRKYYHSMPVIKG